MQVSSHYFPSPFGKDLNIGNPENHAITLLPIADIGEVLVGNRHITAKRCGVFMRFL